MDEYEAEYLKALLEEQDTMIMNMERRINELKDENERLRTRLFDVISMSYPQ